jgi:hypothetical protein
MARSGHTNTRVTGTPGFAAGDLWKEDLKLRVEQCNILAAKDLCDKGSAWPENMSCDVEGG